MEILFYDHDLAVCVKPVGLDSEAQVPAELKKTLGGEIFPVHRLDKNVGGVMVYARTKQAAAALSKAVQDGAMVKEYVAMVHGLPPESGDLGRPSVEGQPKKQGLCGKAGTLRRQKSAAGIHPSFRRGVQSRPHSPAYGAEPPDPGTVCLQRVSAGGRPQIRFPG